LAPVLHELQKKRICFWEDVNFPNCPFFHTNPFSAVRLNSA
jgi:hypothetical protein